jgi:catechol 2,3-dioxygenase-like lactoylglutathione lyase family enzyme
MIRTLHHVGISVVDLDRSIDFYCALLGTDTASRGRFFGELYSTIMGLTGAAGRSSMVSGRAGRVELFEFASPKPRSDSLPREYGVSRLFLTVEDLWRTHECLLAHIDKTRMSCDIICGYDGSFMGCDPDGNRFEVRQRDGSRDMGCSDARPQGRVEMSVLDLSRSVSFYQQMLCMELVGTGDSVGSDSRESLANRDKVASGSAVLRTPAIELRLRELPMSARGGAGAPLPVCDYGISHFCIEVTEIGEEYARLKDAGVEFHCPPLDFFGRATATYARDCDGNVLEMLQLDPA